jgi:ribulose-phosphate 3-epimerase
MTVPVHHLLERAPLLSVGILTADLLHLDDELDSMDEAGVELIHIDVMDGAFCPPLTVGAPVVKAIPDHFVKDVHLMVDEPLGKIEALLEAGAGIVTFQVESTRHPHRVLQYLADSGVLRGVAVNPGTPLSAVEPLMDELELLLVLAVNPGWPGQTFLAGTDLRLADARAFAGDRAVVIGVDGGITRDNVAHVAALGPDLVVAGSAVFDGATPADNARTLLDAIRGAAGGNADKARAARAPRTQTEEVRR